MNISASHRQVGAPSYNNRLSIEANGCPMRGKYHFNSCFVGLRRGRTPFVGGKAHNQAVVMKALAAILMSVPVGHLGAADFPSAQIKNGKISAKIYLPEPKGGFYQGTRFDWSGVLYSLEFQGHDYYGPWFNKTDPAIRDFIYSGPDIIAGPSSAITGPVNEFGPVGFDDAKPGAPFIKIGVGALRKPDGAAYDNFRLYEIADGGHWKVSKTATSVEFIQTLAGPSYGYLYRKTVRLVDGKPVMVIEHYLKNTGSRAIHTDVFNHNFLVLDKQPPGPGFVITVPFPIRTSKLPDKTLAEIHGNRIIYTKTLTGEDVVATPIEGFGTGGNDHQIRIENTRLGVGMKIQTDRPLSKESLWSIRTVIAMEPYVAIDIEPGHEFIWTTQYEYYQLPEHK
jgi:hypothetical protein